MRSGVRAPPRPPQRDLGGSRFVFKSGSFECPAGDPRPLKRDLDGSRLVFKSGGFECPAGDPRPLQRDLGGSRFVFKSGGFECPAGDPRPLQRDLDGSRFVLTQGKNSPPRRRERRVFFIKGRLTPGRSDVGQDVGQVLRLVLLCTRSPDPQSDSEFQSPENQSSDLTMGETTTRKPRLP